MTTTAPPRPAAAPTPPSRPPLHRQVTGRLLRWWRQLTAMRTALVLLFLHLYLQQYLLAHPPHGAVPSPCCAPSLSRRQCRNPRRCNQPIARSAAAIWCTAACQTLKALRAIFGVVRGFRIAGSCAQNCPRWFEKESC